MGQFVALRIGSLADSGVSSAWESNSQPWSRDSALTHGAARPGPLCAFCDAGLTPPRRLPSDREVGFGSCGSREEGRGVRGQPDGAPAINPVLSWQRGSKGKEGRVLWV